MTDNLPIQSSPSTLIELAINQGVDLDKIEKMLVLQERWEKNEAKKAYIRAMTAFKANPPEIEKDVRVQYDTSKGKTDYKHASLANVTKKINSALSEHGLSAAWSTTQQNGSVAVTCTITHEQGHSESTSLTASPDASGSKNAIQAIGSTISYLERYTILALTGLATFDMDDDGNAAASGPVEYINDQQYGSIIDMMNEAEADEGKFLQYLKIESIEKMPLNKFNMAVKALEAKLAKK
jgi:hypothetical protein